MRTEEVRAHFDTVAPDYDEWKLKAHYYHSQLKDALAQVIPRGARVLEVGCGTGDLLASLEPGEGVGTDMSPEMVEIARRKHPTLRFEVHNLMSAPLIERFDHIVAVDVMEHIPSPPRVMETIAAMLDVDGLAVVITANPMWSPILHLAERLNLKMPEGDHTWRSVPELLSAGRAAGLRATSFDRMLLVPKQVPGLVALNSARWASGLRRRLGLIQRLVFRRPAGG